MENKEMCKYARNDIFRVSTPQQNQIIKEVLSKNTPSVRIEVSKPKFNASLWAKDTNDGNTITKR